MTENLNFEKARYNGVVTVIADQIKQISNLEKKYKSLQSEHNILKRTYLNLLDGHLEVVDGKNKTIKKLKEKVKRQKEEYIENLKSIQKEIGYSSEMYESDIDSYIKAWEK